MSTPDRARISLTVNGETLAVPGLALANAHWIVPSQKRAISYSPSLLTMTPTLVPPGPVGLIQALSVRTLLILSPGRSPICT